MTMLKRARDSYGRPICRNCSVHISGRLAYCPRCGLEVAAVVKALWEAKANRPTHRKRKGAVLAPWD